MNKVLPCLQRPSDLTERIDSFGYTAHYGWTIQYVRVIGTNKISKIMAKSARLKELHLFSVEAIEVFILFYENYHK